MGVIGPRDNVFPGPAVALDGPALLVIALTSGITNFFEFFNKNSWQSGFWKLII